MSYSLISHPVDRIYGSLEVPFDKSISHRALILGSIAKGVTEVTNFLASQDCIHTIDALRNLGIVIEYDNKSTVLIHGNGQYGFKKPSKDIYCGNSGTLMRIISGLLAALPFTSVLSGDESLSKRPMQRISEPLIKMGADINTTNNRPPIYIKGSQLSGITYQMPVASAQVKSAILLAALYAKTPTTIIEKEITRDHSERMLESFDINVIKSDKIITVNPLKQDIKATNIKVPSDLSSTAFAIVAALITKNSDIVLKNVGVNPTRTGILTILRQMGGNIYLENETMYGLEPVADIRVKSSQLVGIKIDESHVALAIDEFPIIFIAAACAIGTTIIKGAQELRTKETDRIKAMVEGLINLGVDVTETPDGAVIKGGIIHGGQVCSFSDHRIAMAFAIAGCRALNPVKILNCENIATSFPDFVTRMQALNLNIHPTRDI